MFEIVILPTPVVAVLDAISTYDVDAAPPYVFHSNPDAALDTAVII